MRQNAVNAMTPETAAKYAAEQDSVDGMDDAALMAVLAAEGSTPTAHKAFAALVQRHNQRFYAAAYRLLRDRQEAEDAVQDAFMRLWHRAELWKPEKNAKFTTWFYTILVNECRMRWRKVKGSPMQARPASEEAEMIQLEEAAVAAHEPVEHNIEQRQRKIALYRAIDALPERQKEALTLCFFEGMSNKDAADVMGIGVKALESLIMRAKSGLKEYLR